MADVSAAVVQLWWAAASAVASVLFHVWCCAVAMARSDVWELISSSRTLLVPCALH
jgi:hypothetical protein